MLRSIALYEGEGWFLNKMRKLADKLCGSLELPEEAALNTSKLSAVGGKRMLIENHRGLLSYSDNAVEIMTESGKISVLGSGFIIRTMTKSNLLIYGDFRSVEWCG